MYHKKRVSIIHTVLVKEGSFLYGNEDRIIRSHKEAAEMAAPFFSGLDKECFYVCCLNRKNEPVSMERIAEGTRGECYIDIPSVFKAAILSNASGIICFHNHVSGHVEPSTEDFKVTERLSEIGELLSIPVLDSIIIGEDKHYSFKEEGRI